MSRGEGVFQGHILEKLNNRKVLLNELLWEIASQGNKIEVHHTSEFIRFGVINKAFHNNYLRAINSLQKNGRILKTKVKICSIEDTLCYYPFKTSKLEIKELREKLLPLVKEFITKKGSYQFSDPEIENYTIRDLRENQPIVYKELISKWKEIESDLFINLRNQTQNTYLLIDLINKGRELFQSKNIKNLESLGSIIDNATNIEVPPIYAGRLKSFYGEYFIGGKLRRNSFKNIFYSVIQIGKSHGRSFVLRDVKEYFYINEKNFIASLPNHFDPNLVHEKSNWYTIGNREIRYSPMLDKLIDRHLFSDFIFIESAGR